MYFYSRPCGRGDSRRLFSSANTSSISTHAPAGGATISNNGSSELVVFLLTPLREGRRVEKEKWTLNLSFLLTPLREGRRYGIQIDDLKVYISTHAPAGGATEIPGDLIPPETDISTHAPAGGATRDSGVTAQLVGNISTHAPAGGATQIIFRFGVSQCDFYSRPCGRGDKFHGVLRFRYLHFYSRPCGRGDLYQQAKIAREYISTHAPAGGATRKPCATA